MSNQTIDLNTFTELQDTAGADFVVELVDTFLDEAPGLLAELRRALAAGDVLAFERAAHSLKSNAHTFGALALGAQARSLELGGLSAAQGGAALDTLTAEYECAAAALRDLRHG
jgi:HPt (histidine-containing phosphotransfer) domain-containing protein